MSRHWSLREAEWPAPDRSAEPHLRCFGPLRRGRRWLIALLAALPALDALPASSSEPPWRRLPDTPPPPPKAQATRAVLNSTLLWFATVGQGEPVVLLHGGLADSDWWGDQVAVLRERHRVILLDSRGQGRSARDARPLGYDLMADDVVALLDRLGLPRADLVGWSDGAIVALDLALRYPGRVGKVLAFAANARPEGLRPHPAANPAYAAFLARARAGYRSRSPTPWAYDALLAGLHAMWRREPNRSDADLRSIRAPMLLALGDHDEVVRRDHAVHLAATIPGARLVVLPDVGHFAFLQDPTTFNRMMLSFLDE
jgi:pimeloyl-ACP methyl ester carboxylesterase